MEGEEDASLFMIKNFDGSLNLPKNSRNVRQTLKIALLAKPICYQKCPEKEQFSDGVGMIRQ